ncbi:uncharacterized protein LOC132748604, partial [Ruditapes philippinarum]|uniref:uncharacterized protein LOC132748604 n=1 Tax=Ruditapes philippinarum TaxID=129788 RepID=UPI00295BD893
MEKFVKVYAEVLQVKEECSADGIVCTELEKEMLGSFDLPTITQRGIITNGNGTIKKEVLVKHDQELMLVKYLINTKEISNLVYAVRKLDGDTDVDVILLLDYDTSILKMAHILTTNNKRLIKMGANFIDRQMSLENKQKKSVEMNSCKISNKDVKSDVYCMFDINGTSIDRDQFLLSLPGTKAIRNLVKSFKWKRVIIFYETSTEDEMTALVDGLSLDRVMFALFNIEHVENLHSILQQIYTSSMKSDRGINVIVVCRYECTGHIMNTANRFDSVNSNKTLLKKFAKWLILLYGQRRGSIQALQKCSNDLDNVAVISIPEFSKINIKMMYGLIESSLLDALKEQLTIKSHSKFRNDFLDNLERV